MLKEGRSVVIGMLLDCLALVDVPFADCRCIHCIQDNTNPDPGIRSQWVGLARKHNVPIRCVWFKTPLQLCEHNDAVRSLNKSVWCRPYLPF